MLRTLLALGFALTIPILVSAQTVSSLPLSQFRTIDGLYGAPDGNLYAASGFGKSEVYRITPDGSFSVFATGLSGPIHMAMKDGELFISNWDNGTVHRVLEGFSQLFATVSPGPGGLVFGPDGYLYIAHAPQVGIGGITRVDPSGNATMFASGSGINRPVGIAFDDDGNLYAANLYDPKIHRISPSGEISFFANATEKVGVLVTGHLVFAAGALYATDIGHHQIRRIALDGTVELFAGSGVQGNVNGDLAATQFSQPNGIAVSADGTSLFVGSVSPQNYIKVISLAAATETEPGKQLPEFLELSQNYPNPFNPETSISFNLSQTAAVKLQVYDLLGKKVATLVDEVLPAGAHSVRFLATDLPGGAFLYRIQAAGRTETRLMTLLK